MRVFSATLLLLSACQDIPTSGLTPPGASPAKYADANPVGLHLGEVPYYCVSVQGATTGTAGWQTRVDTIFFPRAEVQERDQTVRFHYIKSYTDATRFLARDCVVPYTEAALRRLDRYLGLRTAGGADQYRARQEQITVQGCVEEGMCLLEPIYVLPPPSDCGTPGCPGHVDEGNNGTLIGPGGSGFPSPLPGDEDEDDDTLDDGPGAFAFCVAVKLGVSGWSSIGGTVVSAYAAWDARRNSRETYNRWAAYRRDVNAGFTNFDTYVNDLYYQAWKDAEHQEKLLYGATAAAAIWASAELLAAAVACAPYAAAPI